jgi:hypothetical protein
MQQQAATQVLETRSLLENAYRETQLPRGDRRREPANSGANH